MSCSGSVPEKNDPRSDMSSSQGPSNPYSTAPQSSSTVSPINCCTNQNCCNKFRLVSTAAAAPSVYAGPIDGSVQFNPVPSPPFDVWAPVATADIEGLRPRQIPEQICSDKEPQLATIATEFCMRVRLFEAISKEMDHLCEQVLKKAQILDHFPKIWSDILQFFPSQRVLQQALDQVKQQRVRLDNPEFQDVAPYVHVAGSDCVSIELWPVESQQRQDPSIAPSWPSWHAAHGSSPAGFKVLIYLITTKRNKNSPASGPVTEYGVRETLERCGIESYHLPRHIQVRPHRNWPDCFSALLVWQDSLHAMYCI